MKKMNFKKGFTLIELLVVVAIIGILASVVLNTLATAGTATTVVCHLKADNAAWAVGSGTKVTPANSWCVDSTGTSKQLTNAYLAGNATVCP